MRNLNKTLTILLSFAGAMLFITGISLAAQTIGTVSGSEFSMLTTITHLLGLMAAWMGLFGLWVALPEGAHDE